MPGIHRAIFYCGFTLLAAIPATGQSPDSSLLRRRDSVGVTISPPPPSDDSLKRRSIRLQGIYLSICNAREFTQSAPAAGAFSLSAFLRNGWGIVARYRIAAFHSPNVPADYEPGSGSLINFGPEDKTPRESARIYSLNGVWKYEPFPSDPRARFSLEAGPALMQYWEKSFTAQPVTSSGGWFFPTRSSNYADAETERNLVSLDAAAKLELPMGRGFGLEMGIWTVLNTRLPLVGFDFGIAFGKLRRRRTSP